MMQIKYICSRTSSVEIVLFPRISPQFVCPMPGKYHLFSKTVSIFFFTYLLTESFLIFIPSPWQWRLWRGTGLFGTQCKLGSAALCGMTYKQARLGSTIVGWLCLSHETCSLGWKLSPHLPLPNFSLKNGCFTDKLSGAMKRSKPWRGEERIFYKAEEKKSSGDSSQQGLVCLPICD